MHLPDKFYAKVIGSMPILCVDAVIKSNEGRFLLVKRRFEPLEGVYWTPGGRVLRGERLTDAFHRIMQTEIGISPKNFQPIGFFEDFFERTRQNVPGGVHTVRLVYLSRMEEGNFQGALRLDEQSSEWRWCEELPQRYRSYTEINWEMILR